MNVRARTGALAALGIAGLGVAFSLPPIAQDPDYHGFADQRTLLGVPHLLNVASNLPFVLVGAWGLLFLASPSSRRSFREGRERLFHAVLFASILLIGIGSAYYHGRPTTATLFWDRLPMTLMFASFLGITVTERVSSRAGAWLFLPLLAAGVWSIVHWRLTEEAGRGDLRFYGLLQCFTMLAVPVMVLLFPPRYTHGRTLFAAAAVYGLAKVFEILDAPIHAAGGLVSGHTLKHLFAGLAAWLVLDMVRARRPLDPAPAPAAGNFCCPAPTDGARLPG